MMKTIVLILFALLLGFETSFSQPGNPQGQLGKSDTVQTKTQDRKQQRKRDSTGAYHDENSKNREMRQSQNPQNSSCCSPQGQGKKKNQGGK